MVTARILTFAELLRRYRRAAGMSQEELAERAGLSRRGISDLERGLSRAPRQDTVELLAGALGLAGDDRTRFAAAGRRSKGPIAAPSAVPVSLRTVGPTPLVGRLDELALLERHLAGEGPPALLLAGEPGIGKSRLLREAADRAQALGWCVLEGGCQRRDVQGPYAPLLGALSRHLAQQPPAQLRAHLQGCAWLVRLLPELAEMGLLSAPQEALSPEQERRLLFVAVGRYLANVAEPAGTLLLLDDLQWAGADALDLVLALLQSRSGPPIRMLGAYRESEVRPQDALSLLFVDLARGDLVTQRTLGVLSAGEASALLDELLRDVLTPDAVVRAGILQRAGGVPFFLVSSAQALRAAQDEDQPFTAPTIPWTVRQSVRQRVGALPETAREVLGLAAVAGRQMRGVLLAAANRPEDEIFDSLAAACQAQLMLAEGVDVYRFSHDLIREVVEAELSVGQRQLWHRRLAMALEQRPEPERTQHAAELAYHYIEGGEQARALPYVLVAGDQAEAMYAHTEAEHWYRRALALAETNGDQAREAEAALKLGAVSVHLTHYAEGAALLESALTRYLTMGDRDSIGQVADHLGVLYIMHGTPEEGALRLNTLLDKVRADAPVYVLAKLYAMVANSYWLGGRYRDQYATAQNAAVLSRTADDRRVVALVALTLGNAQLMQGLAREARSNLEACLPDVVALGDTFYLGFLLQALSDAYEARGEVARAVQHVERAIPLTERAGYAGAQVWMLHRRGILAFIRGAWDQALADFERALALSDETHAEAQGYVPRFWQGHLWRVRGQAERAAPHISRGLARAARAPTRMPTSSLVFAQAEYLLVSGNPEEAYGQIAAHLAQAGYHESIYILPLLPLQAQAALELGRADEAAALIAHATERATTAEHCLALVDALRVRAVLAIERRQWDEAIEALDEALARAHAMPYPYAEAKTLYVYGQLHAAQGELESARKRFEAALVILDSLGERLYAEHVERALAKI